MTAYQSPSFPIDDRSQASFVRESQLLAEIVHVTGEVDLANVDTLRAAIAEAATGSTTIILDLEGCGYIDSTTLGILIAASKTYAGRFLIVAPPGALVHRVLTITSLIEHLPIIDSLGAYTA